MEFDDWFRNQDRLVQIILLVIPFVNWIVEILVRVSALIKNPNGINILGMIIFAIGGLLFAYVDLFSVILTGNYFLCD